MFLFLDKLLILLALLDQKQIFLFKRLEDAHQL